jgi:predicted DNA-binding protein (UPF0251 family)
MSAKIRILRRVLSPPLIKGFKPFGSESGKQNSNPVILLYEEYEALRLSDYDKCNHHQASVMMGVSRPTFTRIYASALQKIAVAFVEGRSISIEGGKVYFDSDWHHCTECDCNFNNPEREKVIEKCPLCGSHQIKSFDLNEIEEDETKQPGDYCYCPHCGFEEEHQFGKPCGNKVCPKCKSFMKRKGTHHHSKRKKQTI